MHHKHTVSVGWACQGAGALTVCVCCWMLGRIQLQYKLSLPQLHHPHENRAKKEH